MKTNFTIRVKIDPLESAPTRGRRPRGGLREFIVYFDANGEALRIKEVKTYALGEPFEAIYHASYWVRGSHSLTRLPRLIIAEARLKLEAKERNVRTAP